MTPTNSTHLPDTLPASRLLRWLTPVVILLSVAMVGIAVTGVVRSYSPVPFWDMWDGYLGFVIRLAHGDPNAWWAQHNEHRIILARVFFWIDLKLFGGMGVSLLVINQLLAVFGACVFILAARDALSRAGHRELLKFVAPFMLAMGFFWSQENNLTWGFQSQFFLAQSVPAAALFLLARSHDPSGRSGIYFVLAAALGVIASGTMANGVLALPVMVLFAVITGMAWDRVMVLAALAVVTVVKYYSGYVMTAGHAPLGQTLLHQPVDVARFVLLYLGSPLYYAAMKVKGAGIAAMAAGAMVMAIAGWQLIACWRMRRQNPLPYAMLAYLAYIGGTDIGTALGRVSAGVEQALSSRYTTPAIMAWMATLVLLLPYFAYAARRRTVVAVATLLLLAAMIPAQLQALANQKSMRFDRMLGATSLELAINDGRAISQIYPFTEAALTIANEAKAMHLSIFAHGLIAGASDVLGTQQNASDLPACAAGGIQSLESLPSQAGAFRIDGWIDRMGTNDISSLTVGDASGRVVGFGIDGKPLPKLPTGAVSHRASGFTAYIPTALVGTGAYSIVSIEGGCVLQAHLPLAIDTVAAPLMLDERLASARDLVGGTTFTGTDIDHTHIEGLTIIGSMVTSDQDMQSQKFAMHRGEHFFYRSGPTAGHQTLSVDGFSPPAPLSTSVEWSRITLEDPRLPDTFTVTVTDDGNAWGEWSAIGLAR